MSNKVVLITGASSGFGQMTVEKLLKKGYTVYATARRVNLMEDLKEKGAKVISMDVTSDEDVAAGVAQVIEEAGRVDVLVNNAGYGGYGMVESVSLEEAHKQFEVNVFGAARLMKKVLPQMRKQRSGLIINMSSVVGRISSPMIGWYGASKHALESLSDALRAEVKEFGINVVLIEPGAVQTGFLDVAMKQLDTVEHEEEYKTKVEGFKKAFINSYSKAPDPEKVTDTIINAIESNNPKARYAVGDAKMGIMVNNILPDKTYDKVMLSMMGMK